MRIPKEVRSQLTGELPQILPSMLLCDFGNLEREVHRLAEAGVQTLHLDIMDGVFVPNFTYGMTLVQAFRKLTDMVLDCHLMMVNPERYIEQFRTAGADVITIHAEATDEAAGLGRQIRSLGALSGIALNPGTPVSSIVSALPEFDLVCVMGVQAGFGGQAFQPQVLAKFAEIRRFNRDILLQIDGGVGKSTLAACVGAGGQLLVAGSAVFRENDYRKALQELRQLAAQNHTSA